MGDLRVTSSGLQIFSKLESRDATAVSGDVSYTGYGFRPTRIIIIGGSTVGSVGATDITNGGIIFEGRSGGATVIGAGAGAGQIVFYYTTDAGVSQTAVISTFDADGFTLTWTKNGAPGALAIPFLVIAFS
jgi:hypothetical protein